MLKFKPSATRLAELQRHSALIFMPVDIYGSCHEIDSDTKALKCLDLILLHTSRLQRYFASCGHAEVVDHPLRYHLPTPRSPVGEGPLLWIGRRCNLGPIVAWHNARKPDEELWILTDGGNIREAARVFGFRHPQHVRVEEWTEQRHQEWQTIAKAAIDIKGSDFRSRHKPPAKMLDFLASAVPVLTNFGSASWLHANARNLGVIDAESWFNKSLVPDYQKLNRQAEHLQETLAEQNVFAIYERLILTAWSRSKARRNEPIDSLPM